MRWRPLVIPVAVVAVLATGHTRPALARYDERDATRDCERAIVDAYGYREMYGENVRETGSDSYEISGKVRVRDGHDRFFSCRIKHREVVDYKLRDGDSHGSGGGSSGTAAAVGVGVLGLAAIAALAARGGDDDHSRKRSGYQADSDADVMADRGYLEEECRRNIVGHLQQDHGSVDRLAMSHAYLDGRDLRGQGDVTFRAGGGRRLEFTCEFDRQGRIHDGYYRYY